MSNDDNDIIKMAKEVYGLDIIKPNGSYVNIKNNESADRRDVIDSLASDYYKEIAKILNSVRAEQDEQRKSQEEQQERERRQALTQSEKVRLPPYMAKFIAAVAREKMEATQDISANPNLGRSGSTAAASGNANVAAGAEPRRSVYQYRDPPAAGERASPLVVEAGQAAPAPITPFPAAAAGAGLDPAAPAQAPAPPPAATDRPAEPWRSSPSSAPTGSPILSDDAAPQRGEPQPQSTPVSASTPGEAAAPDRPAAANEATVGEKRNDTASATPSHPLPAVRQFIPPRGYTRPNVDLRMLDLDNLIALIGQIAAEYRADPEELRALYILDIGPALEAHRRLLRPNRYELLSDAVMFALEPAARLDRLAPCVVGLAPVVRRLLEEAQPKEEGWSASLLALATLLSVSANTMDDTRSHAVRQFAGVYYSDALDRMARGVSDDGRAIRHASTNLVALILELEAGGISDPQSGEVRKIVVKELKDIALASKSQPDSGSDEVARLLRRSGVNLDEAITNDWQKRFTTRMMTSEGEAEPDTLQHAYDYAIAGLINAAERSKESTAGTFFNSAVTMARRRGAHKSMTDGPQLALARVTLNSVGLAWALILNENVGSALEAGNGGDCAVNLFGALADLHRKDRKMAERLLEEAARRLGESYAAFRGGMGPAFMAKSARLNSSFRDLKIEERNPGSGNLLAEAVAVIGSALRLLDETAAPELGVPLSLSDTAMIIQTVFTAVTPRASGDKDDGYDSLTSRLAAEARRLAMLNVSPQESLKRFLDREDIRNNGILVAAGVIDTEGYQALRQNSIASNADLEKGFRDAFLP